MEEKSDPQEIAFVGSAYEAFAKGDVETVMSLLTDDIEYYVSGRSPASGTYKGKDEVLGLFGKMME
ncbi:MAG: nuclear transport factor 2 family protein, partial [Steroidobacteraceae bacterium]